VLGRGFLCVCQVNLEIGIRISLTRRVLLLPCLVERRFEVMGSSEDIGLGFLVYLSASLSVFTSLVLSHVLSFDQGCFGMFPGLFRHPCPAWSCCLPDWASDTQTLAHPNNIHPTLLRNVNPNGMAE
jgi:hypothetical protein